jgi:hypothetical protein
MSTADTKRTLRALERPQSSEPDCFDYQVQRNFEATCPVEVT